MSRSQGYLVLLISGLFLVAVSISQPEFLSDNNEFLKGFVNHEFLNILGVILAITLASIANIHLVFNNIEEKYKSRGGLQKSRHNLKKSAYWLIVLFVAGALAVIVKPIICQSPLSQALMNSLVLLILIWHVLILLGMTALVFRIEPEFPEKKNGDPK